MAGVLGARSYFSDPPAPVMTAEEQAEAREAQEMLRSLPAPAPTPPPELPVGRPAEELARQATPLPSQMPLAEQDGLVLKGAPFAARAATGAGFARTDGADLGFARLPLPPLYEALQPSENEFAPLAAGDVNGDGWPDLAVGTSHGLYLYVNTGGRFAQQELAFTRMRDWTITYTALVDLDGSGSLDLFLCAWMQDCYIFPNTGGEFAAEPAAVLPRGGELATHSAAFADIDRDGDLDIATGPATGLAWNFAPQEPVTIWRGSADGRFTKESLAGPGGETLTMLFTDADGDGWLDLYVGNDFDEPDLTYRNESGRLLLQTGEAVPFARTTESTMSIDTGDIDNDGVLEVYQAAIAFGGAEQAPRAAAPSAPHEACQDGFSDPAEVRNCLVLSDFQTAVVRSRDITSVGECRHFPDARRQRQCVGVGYQWNAAFADVPVRGGSTPAVVESCRQFPAELGRLHDVCEAAAGTPLDYGQAPRSSPDQAPQVKETNLLFAREGDRLADVTGRWGAAYGGWSWNAKFADIDNDTWQDLYITQGTRLRFRSASNVLYRNQEGGGFAEQSTELGLAHRVPTGASLFVDYDMDGRLDVITHPFALTPVIWHNETAAPGALEISLRDGRSANHDAIGARVEIRSPEGLLQVREVKASGGYGSDDVKTARFGLGSWSGVSSIAVAWPDGQRDTLSVPSLGPGRYVLERSEGRA